MLNCLSSLSALVAQLLQISSSPLDRHKLNNFQGLCPSYGEYLMKLVGSQMHLGARWPQWSKFSVDRDRMQRTVLCGFVRNPSIEFHDNYPRCPSHYASPPCFPISITFADDTAVVATDSDRGFKLLEFDSVLKCQLATVACVEGFVVTLEPHDASK
jgi:hypothetical protein